MGIGESVKAEGKGKQKSRLAAFTVNDFLRTSGAVLCYWDEH